MDDYVAKAVADVVEIIYFCYCRHGRDQVTDMIVVGTIWYYCRLAAGMIIE